MNYHAGLDLAVGITRYASRCAVCILDDTNDNPIHLEYLRPETVDFSERCFEIADFFCDVVRPFSIATALIPRPKMSSVRFTKFNKKKGKDEIISTTPRSLFDLCEARGAVTTLLIERFKGKIKLYTNYTEGQIKKQFTGNGRADKDVVYYYVKRVWPNCPKLADAADSYMHATVGRTDFHFSQ